MPAKGCPVAFTAKQDVLRPNTPRPRGQQVVVIEALRVQNVLQHLYNCLEVCIVLGNLCQKPDVIETAVEDETLQLVLKDYSNIVECLSFDGNILRRPFQNKWKQKAGRSLQDIFRLIYTKPKAFSLCRKSITFTDLQRTFLNQIRRLITICEERLMLSPAQELRKAKYVHVVKDKAKRAHNQIVLLKRDLDSEKEARDRKIQSQDTMMCLLAQNIDCLKDERAKELLKTIDESEKKKSADVKSFESKEEKMAEEMLSLRAKLSADREAHFLEETTIRKKKFKLATELQNWVATYDQDVGQRQDEIDELRAEHESDLEDLRKLEEHFTKLEKEYDAIMEERLAHEEEQRRLAAEQARRDSAAMYIQAFWKGFKVRNNTTGAKPAKKKKGKSKKGKKGK